MLLRRWLAQQEGISLGKETLVLAPEQRLGVAALYAYERTCLLQATEELLWLGERETGAPPACVDSRVLPAHFSRPCLSFHPPSRAQ